MGNAVILNELQKSKNKKLKDQQKIIDWFTTDCNDYTHAVTLTFPFEMTNADIAEIYYGRFKKYINERCFRRPKTDSDKIKMAVILEGAKFNKHLHYHCAMRCPTKLTEYDFSYRISKVWRHTVKNKIAHVDIQPYSNNGWIEYCTKEISATHTEGISIHNDF